MHMKSLKIRGCENAKKGYAVDKRLEYSMRRLWAKSEPLMDVSIQSFIQQTFVELVPRVRHCASHQNGKTREIFPILKSFPETNWLPYGDSEYMVAEDTKAKAGSYISV